MEAKPKLWLRVFLPFAVGYYLSYLLRNVNAVIAPDLRHEFHLDSADLGLMTSAYLFAFGSFQLPLGILLDRYGARRVEATLLLLAALGTALFGLAQGVTQLVAARALIGLGVSACLMASFKAFSQWFPPERHASLNAAIMAAGSMGALSATVPLDLALPLIGWRGCFFALAMFCTLAAGIIFSTPDRPAAGSESFRAQLRGLGLVLGSRAFWRYGPLTAMVVGSFMAIQGLWAVPFLINFSGYTREVAASHLLFLSLGMLLGFLAIAASVTRLAARGISPESILTAGMGVGLAIGVLIVFEAMSSYLLWSVMGVVFSVCNLAYVLLAKNFPAQMAGRANTALNLLAFVGAFSVQWGFGLLVDHFQAGDTLRQAYHHAYTVLLVLQAASYAWFVASRRWVSGA